MSMLGTQQPTAKDYKDGRTKQAFKDETDINKLIQRAEKTGTISHLNKHEARYGDFANFDFFEAQVQLAAGGEIFADLPAEIRSEFNQSPAQFFNYVNDPANKDRLEKLLPDLAAPGRQLPRIAPDNADETAARVASEQATPVPNATPAPEPSPAPDAASGEALTPAQLAGSSAST